MQRAGRGPAARRDSARPREVLCSVPAWPWGATAATVTLWRRRRGADPGALFTPVLPKPAGSVQFAYAPALTALVPSAGPAAGGGGFAVTLFGAGLGIAFGGQAPGYACRFTAVAACVGPDGSQCLDAAQMVGRCAAARWAAACLSEDVVASPGSLVNSAALAAAAAVGAAGVAAGPAVVCTLPTWNLTAYGKTFVQVQAIGAHARERRVLLRGSQLRLRIHTLLSWA